MRRPGQALSRAQLLEGAWDIGYESRSNLVDVYVRYLREKIDRPFGRDVARDRARRRLPAAGGRRMSRAADPRPADARLHARDGGRARRDGLLRLRPRRRARSSRRSTRACARRRVDVAHLDRRTARLSTPTVGGGMTLARCSSPRGASSRPTRRGCRRCSPREAVQRVAAGERILRSQHLPGLRGALARARRADAFADGRRRSSSRARSRRATRRSTTCSASSSWPGPLALLLASLAGYGLAAAALRPVEAMRAPRRGDLGLDARDAAAGARRPATRSRGSPRR